MLQALPPLFSVRRAMLTSLKEVYWVLLHSAVVLPTYLLHAGGNKYSFLHLGRIRSIVISTDEVVTVKTLHLFKNNLC